MEEVIPFFGGIVKGLINRWLSGEELDVEEKEQVTEVGRSELTVIVNGVVIMYMNLALY